jgi:Tol biopolymer transport system component
MKSIRLTSLFLVALLALLISGTATAQLVDYFGGKNKVNYDTFNWRVYETEHFLLHYYPEEEEYLDEVVNWSETAYEILSQRLNHQLSKKIPIIFFKTHSEFEQQNVIPMFLPEGVGAFAEPVRSRMLIPLDDPPAEMQRLFTHELTHQFEYDILYPDMSVAQRMFNKIPLWVMEGLAEHMAGGFSEMDEMLVRDAVVNDFVPTIEEINRAAGYYIPYVYGNVIYDYIEAKFGAGAVKNFIWEIRKNGPNPGGVMKAITELFKVDDEKFSRDMRRWLRDKYVPDLVEKEEPEEYGEMIRHKEFKQPVFSASPSPSGDLVACLSFAEGDIDLMLLSAKDGSLFRNLTPGYSNRYEYFIGQGVTSKTLDGHDIAWSPDGRLLAVFARREKNRDLILIDSVDRSIRKQITVDADQALNPSFMPDGKHLLLSASKNGIRDIFLMNLESGELTNLTEDDAFDYAPVASPDGKTIVYTSVVDDEYKKLFKFELDSPETKEQLSYGSFDDKQPNFSPDGKRLLYISTETGINNLFSYNMETEEVLQYTDVLGGVFLPAFDPIDPEMKKIYFSGYLKRQYHLYTMQLEEPLRVVDTSRYKRQESQKIAGFTPMVKIPINEDELNKQPTFDWNIDDIFAYGGVASDGTVLTIAQARFTDMFGDESISMMFNTIADMRSYMIQYFNQKSRINWGLSLFDYNSFLAGNPNVFRQPATMLVERTTVENMGVTLFTRYAFNKFMRAEVTAGFNSRSYIFDSGTLNSMPAEARSMIDERFKSGNMVHAGLSLIGDNTRYNPAFGPLSGRRWELSAEMAPGFRDGEFLGYKTFSGEIRNYFKVSDSMVFATRIFAGHSSGDAPDIFIFGGMNTLRGTGFYSMVGNKAAYMNNEFRFPLIDLVAFPLGIRIANIRGLFFADIGTALYSDQEFVFKDEDGRLQDAVASYGFGVNFNFMGLPINLSWSKGWDGNVPNDAGTPGADVWGFDFWIGPKF